MRRKENMNIEYINIDKIKPYEKNPRINDKAVKYVAESIDQFGFKSPIIVDTDYTIICGHTRYKASQQLGLLAVPCIVARDLTPEQVKAYRIADNKVGEIAEWDVDLLSEELEDLLDMNIDMSQFGFDIDIPEVTKEVEEDNFDVDKAMPKVPTAKLGDVYQLGNHRLMCGDSTSAEDVAKLMNGNEADLLYTDPPYNVNVSNSDGLTIENDNMAEDDFMNFLDNAFNNASNSLKVGGAFYIWHGDSERVAFQETAENHELMVKQTLIWVKNSFNFGRQDYKWQHEPVLYGWKEGAGHYFVEEYNHPTVIEDELDLDAMKKEDMKKLLEEIITSKTPSTIIHENKPVKNDLHPTMKPLKMCADMIHNSSREHEIVLDLFGGSGSTLMACEQIDRNCYMMEYDPYYVDVIIARWEEFTGKKAEKIC